MGLAIICWIVMGGLCAYWAKQRGRTPLLWFFAGLFLGIIGVLLLFILPIRKEFMRPQEKKQTVLPPGPLDEDSEKTFVLWYFMDEQESQQGPMSEKAFLEAKQKGQIQPLSYVWNTSMEGWKRLEEV